MRVRYKKSGYETWSSYFNVHGLGEVLLPDTSEFISELDIWLAHKSEWKDMNQAFKDGDLITDNYNTTFFEPQTEEDKKRGYTL